MALMSPCESERRQMLVKCREAALRRAPLMAIASAMQGEETWFRDKAFCCKTVEDESVKIHAIPAESDFQAASVLQKTVESGSGESCRGGLSLGPDSIGFAIWAWSHSFSARIDRWKTSVVVEMRFSKRSLYVHGDPEIPTDPGQ
ncbi:hypothetical protein F2Q70_00024923 [Brassica cretica]|uniref:Uncharacterized protein n=1 Tax=Brassica cretica TaxID=69181 RepID=A0A8S9L747_BRACR|nr:hypothetical protein F2Q70_00024923 [Brassica cretica]